MIPLNIFILIPVIFTVIGFIARVYTEIFCQDVKETNHILYQRFRIRGVPVSAAAKTPPQISVRRTTLQLRDGGSVVSHSVFKEIRKRNSQGVMAAANTPIHAIRHARHWRALELFEKFKTFRLKFSLKFLGDYFNFFEFFAIEHVFQHKNSHPTTWSTVTYIRLKTCFSWLQGKNKKCAMSFVSNLSQREHWFNEFDVEILNKKRSKLVQNFQSISVWTARKRYVYYLKNSKSKIFLWRIQ